MTYFSCGIHRGSCSHLEMVSVVLHTLLYSRSLACSGMYGQLGHGDQEKQICPKSVEALKDHIIYLVACGNSHTVS